MKTTLFYRLFKSNQTENKKILEFQTFPYTFTSNGHRLRNYLIYGDSQGVGDLDSTTQKYIIPVRINSQQVDIILNEPLGEDDYIDFREQKRFNSDDTSETVSLKAIPTFDGINVLNVDTEVQPSKILIQGNISVFEVSEWENVQALVRAGLHDKYFTVGDQLVCQKNGSDLTWDIIGFDCDTPTNSQFTHSLTLQLHDCLANTMQFDAPEALYYAENGLAAGTYNFTLPDGYDTGSGGGKTYQFTLESAVPEGGQLTFGWSYGTQAANAKITSYSGASSTTQIEQVSVTEGSAGTSLGTADGTSTNLNEIKKTRFGSNNYSQSAIRQFLNSSAAAGSVWTSKNNFDRPPTWNSSTAGFMNGLDSDFLAVVGIANKVTAISTPNGGGSVTLNDKFFLLSRSEVFGGLENDVNEGSPYPYYEDYSDLSAAGTSADTNRKKYKGGSVQKWWLRSPNSNVTATNRDVPDTGEINYSFVYLNSGICPACVII